MTTLLIMLVVLVLGPPPAEPAALASPEALGWGEVRMMTVTAYCPCEKCCGRWADGMTAGGQPVTANGGRFVAADRSIPFHTLVTVPGYAGSAHPSAPVTVLDRGGAIRGDRLDVFFPTHEAALAWGRRRLEVTIWR